MKKIIIVFIFMFSCLGANSQVDSIYRDVSLLKKNIIKIKPSSYFFGYSQITYERSLSPRRSVELNLGLIGLGHDFYNRDPMGFSIRTGYKFYLGDRKIKRSFMKGFYLMPEIAFCMYDKNVRYISDGFWDWSGLIKSSDPIIISEYGQLEYYRPRKYYMAAIGTVGYQWNINRFVIEYNLGLGLGYYNNTIDGQYMFSDSVPDDEHHFGFYGGNSGGYYFVHSLNFKIGYMF